MNRSQGLPSAGGSLLWMNLARIASVGFVVCKYALAHLLEVAAGKWRWARGIVRNRVSGPERLRIAIEELGGCFIKFGQMLALQPDIISLEYCNALFNLLDRVSPFSYSEVECVFKEETGRLPSEVFDCFEKTPLATASIGQVHVAWLNGRKLAVKVQRPTVQRDFAGDVRLMTTAIRLIRTLRVSFLQWMIEPMSEFVAWTREELDYRREAAYMRQLRVNAQGNPHERVPEVLEEFTTRRTLVMEFMPGITVLAYLRALEQGDEGVIEKLEREGFDSHAVASRIIDNFLGDAFQHGLFHADLHPANLMILPGSVVGYIDFGITGTISAYSRQNLVALTLAYTSGDLAGMCEAFFRVSTMDSRNSASRFRAGLARDARSWYESDGRAVRLKRNFTLVMLDMLRLSRESGVWPERDVIKYIRSAIAIDGLITRFAPTFDLGNHLRETCDAYLKWNLRRKLFAMDNLIGLAETGCRLARDGNIRALRAISRLSDAAISKFDPMEGNQSRQPGLRAFCLGLLMAASCFAAAWSSGPAIFGLNLFTAESAMGAGCFLLLIRNFSNSTQGG